MGKGAGGNAPHGAALGGDVGCLAVTTTELSPRSAVFIWDPPFTRRTMQNIGMEQNRMHPSGSRPVPGCPRTGSQCLPRGDRLTKEKLACVGLEVHTCFCELSSNHSHSVGRAPDPRHISQVGIFITDMSQNRSSCDSKKGILFTAFISVVKSLRQYILLPVCQVQPTAW